MKLTSENVETIFGDCLFETVKEAVNGVIIVEGLICKFGFNPSKIKEYENNICEMLNELPLEFREENGGMTFLNGYINKNKIQWGGQASLDKLLCLGNAIGKVKCLTTSPEIWSLLPGGAPYYVITKEKFKVEIQKI